MSVASLVYPDPLGAVLPTDEITLKRHLGLFSGVCFIIGSIIGKLLTFYLLCLDHVFFFQSGTGIFVSPKGVLRETQSVGLCLIIWVVCGFVSLLGMCHHLVYISK